MKSSETTLLSRQDVAYLLSIGECMKAVEQAFKSFAEGKTKSPKILGVHVHDGGFHIKAGAMQLSQNYFVAKANANFPANRTNYGLPTIQGVIIVCNADNGKVLALMDSIEITIIRTGAATGVAAQYLSRKDSKVVTIWGCGNQGRISLKALLTVRQIDLVYAYDTDSGQAAQYADELSRELNIRIIAVDDPKIATRQSDICITCTPSKKPFLGKEDVRPGTFIAAVGTDNEDKNEIHPDLIASSKLIVDLSEQCATIGDLHHAMAQGKVTLSHIHAELGEVIAGKKPGRTSDEEIIVFDSTGTALQDVGAASIVYEKAIASGLGSKFNFAN
jgi:alanine dehydrogenase